jgi:O-antigen/teichoic acid export membrane protein
MLKNVGSNWIITIATIAATFVLLPFNQARLGMDGYGTWLLIVSLTGSLNLLMLGVPMASIRYFSGHAAAGRTEELNRAIASCVGLYLMMAAAALVVGTGLRFGFDAWYAHQIKPDQLPAAHAALWWIVVFIAIGFVARLPYAVMAAYNELWVRNVIAIGGLALRLGLNLTLMSWHASIVVLGVVQLTVLLAELLVALVMVGRRYPGVRFSLTGFSWPVVRGIFSFSAFVLVLQLGLQLSFQTDALVIGHAMGVAAVTIFASTNQLTLYLMEFVLAIAETVMPQSTRLWALGREEELRETFLKWSKVVMSMTVIAGIYLVVFGPSFLAWWLSPTFKAPAVGILSVLMAANLFFLPARGVALPTVMGMGKPALPTTVFLAAAVCNLGLSLWLVRSYGLTGVAIGTAIPNALFACVVVTHAARTIGLSMSRYLRYVLPKALIGGAVVLVLMYAVRDTFTAYGVIGLVAAGFCTVGCCAVVWALFVYRNDPFVDLLAALPRRARRSS